MLRNDLRRPSALRVLPALLGAGFLVAAGVGLEAGWLAWPAVALVAAGLALVLWQLGSLLLDAPRNRMVVVSRTGVALVCLHTTAALLLGTLLLARGDRPLRGITHERFVLIHLHVAVIGWLALLIVTSAGHPHPHARPRRPPRPDAPCRSTSSSSPPGCGSCSPGSPFHPRARSRRSAER